MAQVKCPSCGNAIEVAGKKSATPWLIGCLVAVLTIPVIVAVIGLLAAIAIPSFVKARNTAQMNGCVNNMRMIDAGKEMWSVEAGVEADQPADTTAVNKYLRDSAIPVCPAQGTYTYHNVGVAPECSVHGTMFSPTEFGHPGNDYRR